MERLDSGTNVSSQIKLLSLSFCTYLVPKLLDAAHFQLQHKNNFSCPGISSKTFPWAPWFYNLEMHQYRQNYFAYGKLQLMASGTKQSSEHISSVPLRKVWIPDDTYLHYLFWWDNTLDIIPNASQPICNILFKFNGKVCEILCMTYSSYISTFLTEILILLILLWWSVFPWSFLRPLFNFRKHSTP